MLSMHAGDNMTDSFERRQAMPSSPNLLETCEVFRVDDILVTRFNGDFTLEIMKELQAMARAQSAQYGYRLLLLDVRNMGVITPEARAFLVEDQKRESIESAVALVGASFAIRTIASMLTRAVKSLTKVSIALRFFDTEDAARNWLGQERNRLRASIASAKLT